MRVPAWVFKVERNWGRHLTSTSGLHTCRHQRRGREGKMNTLLCLLSNEKRQQKCWGPNSDTVQSSDSGSLFSTQDTVALHPGEEGWSYAHFQRHFWQDSRRSHWNHRNAQSRVNHREITLYFSSKHQERASSPRPALCMVTSAWKAAPPSACLLPMLCFGSGLRQDCLLGAFPGTLHPLTWLQHLSGKFCWSDN